MRGSFFFSLIAAGLAAACNRPPDRPATPPAPRSVVLITIDTLRADHVRPDVMPALTALGRESVVFEQAITVSPLTLPAHASLLTGAYPVRHGVRDNLIYTLPTGVPTFAEAFRRHGYVTAAFVSTIVLDHRHGLARGFDVYDDEVGDAERPASDTLARAQKWLDAVSSEPRASSPESRVPPSPQSPPASPRPSPESRAPSPVFLWIHLFEPHAPYRTGSYAAEVTSADRELGRFFDDLRRRPRWTDTVVAVTADHGEMLGEHGERTHGFFLYESAIRIPWLLKAPGLTPGRFPHQVRIVDVLPTVSTLALGQAASGIAPDTVDGVDLTKHLRDGSPPRLEAYSETWLPRHQFGWSELQAVRTDRAKLIRGPSAEAYDIVADPREEQDLAGNRPDLVSRLGSVLTAIQRISAPSSRLASQDPMLRERFMSLGYLGYSPATAGTSGTSLSDPRAKLPVYSLLMEATELISTRKNAEALARIDRAIALDANVAQAYFLRGTVLGTDGRFREAVAALDKTLALNPRHVGARFKLALALIRIGDANRARQTLEQVLADEPENVRAWHNLAALAYTEHDLARAESLERKAVTLDPNYVEAWNTLGAIAIVQKRPADAIAALEKAAGLAPQNGQVLANLALAYDDAGRAADADAAARQACKQDRRFCS